MKRLMEVSEGKFSEEQGEFRERIDFVGKIFAI